MNCPSCSAPLKPGARFCAECGATVSQAPAYTDKTMIASPLPPASDRTAPMNAGAPQYGPPAPQQYGQPAQPQYGQPAPQQYPQPQYGQPQYAQGGQPYGYNVPTQAPVSPSKGFVSGLLMLISSLAMGAGVFLPFLFDSTDSITLYEAMVRLSEYGASDVPGEAWIFIAIPILIVLSLLASGLALWRRRNVWAVFTLLFGLVLSGFLGLLMLGASVAENSDFAVGSGVVLMMASAFVLFVTSIVFLATRKLPR